MLETLSSIDRTVFLFINVQLANPISDFVMPLVTSNLLLRVMYLAAMILLLWKGDAKLRWLVVVSVITLALTDQLAAGLLKPWIGRLRPCHVLTDINLLVNCGSGKAFPSAHAANAFGQAVLFSLCYSRVRVPLVTFAVLVAVSRVFVGVHYPGDVLAGSLVGGAVGLVTVFGFGLFVKRINEIEEAGESDHAART